MQKGGSIELTQSHYNIHFKTASYPITGLTRPTREDAPAIDSNQPTEMAAYAARENAYLKKLKAFMTARQAQNKTAEDMAWAQKNYFYQRAHYQKTTLKPQGSSFAVDYQPQNAHLSAYQLQQISQNASKPQSILLTIFDIRQGLWSVDADTTTLRLIAMDNLEKIDSAQELAYIQNRDPEDQSGTLNLYTQRNLIAAAQNVDNAQGNVLVNQFPDIGSEDDSKQSCADYGFDASQLIGKIRDASVNGTISGLVGSVYFNQSLNQICTDNDYANTTVKGSLRYSKSGSKTIPTNQDALAAEL